MFSWLFKTRMPYRKHKYQSCIDIDTSRFWPYDEYHNSLVSYIQSLGFSVRECMSPTGYGLYYPNGWIYVEIDNDVDVNKWNSNKEHIDKKYIELYDSMVCKIANAESKKRDSEIEIKKRMSRIK